MASEYMVTNELEEIFSDLPRTIESIYRDQAPPKPHPAAVIRLLRSCNYHSPDVLAPFIYELSIMISQYPAPSIDQTFYSLAPADAERLLIGMSRDEQTIPRARSLRCPVTRIVGAARTDA